MTTNVPPQAAPNFHKGDTVAERLIESLGGTLRYKLVEANARVYSLADCINTIVGVRQNIPDDLFVPLSDIYQEILALPDSLERIRTAKLFLYDNGAIPSHKVERLLQYREQGKPSSWQDERINGIVDRKRFTDALSAAVANSMDSIYGHATNELYKHLWERTKEMLRRDLGLPPKANIRDRFGELALMYTALAEKTAARLLEHEHEVGYDQAIRIVSKVAAEIGRQAASTSQMLKMDLVTERPLQS
ncbi:MAG TPA: hypothetical protein PLQ56_13965 [Aggregatilineales bacterium]|nr:hypothetical protein [Aggregatilineales bacterium]